jgi:hypothetical protein
MVRPTKYHPDRVAAILDALRLGATVEHAAAAAGVHRDTVHGWRRRYSAFNDAINVAEGAGVVASLRVINDAAAAGTWQAAAWLLERRHPATYGRRPFGVATSVQVAQPEDPMAHQKRLLDFLDALGSAEASLAASAGHDVPVLETRTTAVTATVVADVVGDDDPWHVG